MQSPMLNYGVLPEQAQEDALHSTRLLQVEERPFQRVARSLLGKGSHLKWASRQLPSPPPEGEEAQIEEEDEATKRQSFYDEILFDFAALESSTIRIQLIHNSNQRERERYAVEKAKILETAQAVRDNTVELRAQLAEAQRVLGLRKGYDDLAKKLIPDDGKLKPRDTCQDEIEELEKEIEDLHHESAEYENTWISRREAFDRIVGEGEAMIKLIKGIKDDPEPEEEKDEHMESGDKHDMSGASTPIPDGGTPMADGLGNETPMREGLGNETPLLEREEEGFGTPARLTNKFLDIDNTARSYSRQASPASRADEVHADTEMEEDEGEAQPTSPSGQYDGMVATAEDMPTPSQEVVEEMDET